MRLFSSPRKDSAPPARGSPDESAHARPRWFGTASRNSRIFDNDTDLSRDGAAYGHSSYSSPRPGSSSHGAGHSRGNSTDRTTVTLAQRLNELAASNADGLLGDEEYRMLRQNLFERFGAGSQIPTESPIVKLSPPEPSLSIPFRGATYPADVGSSRPASIKSNSSRVSTITSALRNALRRSSVSQVAGSPYDSQDEDYTRADDLSMVSGPSNSASLPSRRRLKYQGSINSLQSSTSGRPPNNHDARSVSSYKTGLSSKTGRTSTSKGGPPSSYHRPRRQPRQPLELDGEESSAEIQAEINAVEMEKQQLMENFQGLEVSAVTRGSSARKPRSATSNGDRERPSSMWTVRPDNHEVMSRPPSPPPVPKLPLTLLKPVGPSIAERKRSLGMLSTASAKFSKSRDHIAAPSSPVPSPPAALNSSHPPAPVTPSKSINNKVSGFFRRRTSPSPSSKKTPDQPSPVPPVPPIPQRSASSPATTNGNGPTRSLHGESVDANAVENIHKRKEETAARYDQRLDFLRAKLKGAELRERLTK